MEWNDKMIRELGTGKYVEGSCTGLVQGTAPAFIILVYGNLRADISTQDPPNTMYK